MTSSNGNNGNGSNGSDGADPAADVDANRDANRGVNQGTLRERLRREFAVDESGLTENVQRAGLSILPISINTVTAGADFAVGVIRFTLGVGYGWGREVDQELTDLINQSDPSFEATYVFRSMKLIFGFEVGG